MDVYMYGRHIYAYTRGKTAIVGNVLAGARMHRMRLHRHRRHVYAPTYMYPYNRPYCFAIAFQPSTVYGLARLLVLCRGACLSVTFVGVHAFPRRRERCTWRRHTASGRARVEKRERTLCGYIFRHSCVSIGLHNFLSIFLISHSILENYTILDRLDYFIINAAANVLIHSISRESLDMCVTLKNKNLMHFFLESRMLICIINTRFYFFSIIFLVIYTVITIVIILVAIFLQFENFSKK